MRVIDEIKKAEKLQDESKFAKALSIYEKIDKNLRDDSFDREWLFYFRLSEGHCARLAGDFKKSINYYRLALKLAKEIDERAVADAYAGLGTALRAIGKLYKAIEVFNIAWGIYKKIDDVEGQAYVLWARGGTLRFMGSLKQAFESFKKSLTLYKRLGDRAGIGYSLCGLGGVSRIMGDFEKSLEFYTEANAVFKKIKDKFGIAYSYCGIANANRMLGNFEKAKKYFALATKNYEDIGDKISYAYTLWGEGTLAKVVGDTDKAMEKFLKAEKIFAETGDKRGLIYTELGKVEVEFTRSEKIDKRKFRSLLAISKKYGYNFERLHIVLAEKMINGEKIDQLYNEYKKLGSKFLERIDVKIPLNLP